MLHAKHQRVTDLLQIVGIVSEASTLAIVVHLGQQLVLLSSVCHETPLKVTKTAVMWTIVETCFCVI